MAVALSNAERKRQARVRQLVEQERAARQEQGAVTAFRVEEQFWKTRGEVPDWSLAFSDTSQQLHIDPASLATGSPSSNGTIINEGTWTDRRAVQWRIQKFSLGNGKHAFTFLDKPG